MRKIRVLAMLEARSVGGSAKPVLEFAREAYRTYAGLPEIELSVLTFDRGHGECQLTSTIREMGIPLDIVFERRRFDLNVVAQLQAAIEARGPNVVWSNSVKSHFLVRWAGLNRKRRWVAFHHGYTTTDTKMRLYNHLDRWSLRAADRVLTSSAAFVNELARKNVEPAHICVQHMPIRPFGSVSAERKRELRERLGIGNEAHVLLSVGRLSHEKGHTDLIRAFRKMRELRPDSELRLLLVGEGPERAKIEFLIRSLELKQVVTLVGQQDEIDPYYAIADILLLPSHSEGCPNVLLEAMAAGVPVVANAVGGIPEIAIHGKNAILTRKGDTAGFAAATIGILEDHGFRNQLISYARQTIAQKSPEAFFKSIASVLSGACTFEN